MMQNIINNLERKLKELVGKSAIISQDGFLKAKYPIDKINYFIEHEIINIKDERSQNYLTINSNQIYKIEINENDIKLYLDNDTIILIQVKER